MTCGVLRSAPPLVTDLGHRHMAVAQLFLNIADVRIPWGPKTRPRAIPCESNRFSAARVGESEPTITHSNAHSCASPIILALFRKCPREAPLRWVRLHAEWDSPLAPGWHRTVTDFGLWPGGPKRLLREPTVE